MTRLPVTAVVLALLLGLAACVHNPPRLDGEAATPPSASSFWVPSKEVAKPAANEPATAIPAELTDAQHHWSLVDVVDLALRNNPATRASWQDARAAASRYGSARGSYWPTVDVDGTYTRAKSTSSSTSPFLTVPVTYYGPSVQVNYLLFDFGGRGATVEAARQALIAADFGHNAVLQDMVFQVESAYFRYMATKALLSAQRASLDDARTQLDAANERHSVGVATIADVLQAQTAFSRAQLALEDTQGRIQTTRGALAVVMGLPANVPYDIEDVPQDPKLKFVAEAVESLIKDAMAQRPDLAAARAQAEKASVHVREVQAKGWPSLSVSGSAGRTYYEGTGLSSDGYSAGLFLKIPLFTGFSQTYDVMEAKAQAEAAKERTMGLEQQVIFQVWDSYYGLQTATQRVRTAADLMNSATQSREVAFARYKEGVGSLLDLMTADSALADARAQRISAWFDYFTSLARLARDTGLLGLHGENPLVESPSPVVKSGE